MADAPFLFGAQYPQQSPTSPSLAQALGGCGCQNQLMGPAVAHSTPAARMGGSSHRGKEAEVPPHATPLPCCRAPEHSMHQRVLSPESFSLVVTCQTHMLQCCGTWPQPWRSSFILWTSELFPESFKSSQASMVKVSIQCFLAGLCKPVFDIRSPLQTGMWNVGEAQEGCSWSCLLAISYQLKNECFINVFENVCIWSSH